MSDSDGTLTDRYGYDAFGNALDNTGTGTQPYRFAGEHFDPDAQMQYHRERWYDPAVGRFASLDPFSGNPRRPATLHKYAYAGGDPVNQVDPSGLFTLGGIGAGLSAGISLALNAYSAYSTIVALGEFATGQRELNPHEIGMTILWAYVGSKAGLLFGRLESVLRKSGCLSNSFSGDTLVQTDHGLRRIDEIKVDELVASRDMETGKEEFQPVSAVMTSTKLSELAVLTLESGAVIEATPEHLILADGDWVQAQHIEPGMELFTQNAKTIKIVQTTRETRELAVYDLTVAKNRNFFVSKDRVLVHNISPCEKAAQGLAKAVPKTCTGYGNCIDFAEKFEEILINKGVKGKRLCVRSKGGKGAPYSDEHGILGENSFHYGVQIGELIFDNNWVDGIPVSEWLKDMGGSEYIGHPGSGTMMELVEQEIGSPFNCARR